MLHRRKPHEVLYMKSQYIRHIKRLEIIKANKN